MTSHRQGLSRSLLVGLVVALPAAVGSGLFVLHQAREEYRTSVEDLDRRAGVLLYRNAPPARSALALADEHVAQSMGERLEGHSRLLGFVLVRPDGRVVASGSSLADLEPALLSVIRRSIDEQADIKQVVRGLSGTTHVLAMPLSGPDGVSLGAIAVLHDAAYLEDRLTRGMLRVLLFTLGVGVTLLVLVTALVWSLFERPMLALADWMRRLRFGTSPEHPPGNLPVRRLVDESAHLAAGFTASELAALLEIE